jgi:hypothetical protein
MCNSNVEGVGQNWEPIGRNKYRFLPAPSATTAHPPDKSNDLNQPSKRESQLKRKREQRGPPAPEHYHSDAESTNSPAAGEEAEVRRRRSAAIRSHRLDDWMSNGESVDATPYFHKDQDGDVMMAEDDDDDDTERYQKRQTIIKDKEPRYYPQPKQDFTPETPEEKHRISRISALHWFKFW